MSKACIVCSSGNINLINSSLLNMKQSGETFKSIAGRFENMTPSAVKHHFYEHLKPGKIPASKNASMSPDANEQPVSSPSNSQGSPVSGSNDNLSPEEPGDARRAKLEAMLDQAMTMYSTEMRAGDYKAAKQSQPIILGFLNAIAAYDASHGLAENNQDITLRWADDVKGELQIKYYDELIHEGKGKALPAPDISARK